jgi:hypothetical protein
MKRLAAIAIAFALTSSPLAALAQGASTTATVPSKQANEVGSAGNYGSLISSLNAGKMADVKTFTSASTVNCVNVSTLKDDTSGDAVSLDNALTKSATLVIELKTAIKANADLKAKLDTATCPIEEIVAVTTEVDGSYTVYVDDRT